MRTRKLSLLLLMSLLLLLSNRSYAQRRQGRRTNPQARQSTANQQTPLSAAVAGETGDDEQQALARVRGYQLLMEREEKRLSQRMAYAAQLRQQGLQKEDQRLLDRAEQYERKALAAYQGRIQQFEKTNLNSGVSRRISKAPQGKQSTTQYQDQRRSSQTKRKSARKRSSRSAKSVWSWLR